MRLIVNQTKEQERVQRRYSELVAHYPNTIIHLRRNPVFKSSASRLVQEKGLKEWHLALVVANLIFNYCMNERKDYVVASQEDIVDPFVRYPETEEPIHIPDEWLVFEKLDSIYSIVLFTYAKGLGAKLKLERFNPLVLERLLKYRGVFFVVDVPHDPIFPELFPAPSKL